MSQKIGFLVVNRKTGYMLEGKDHAAKIFEREADARSACGVMSSNNPVALDYGSAAKSLLKGSTFCFDSEEGHQKFLARVRNDPGNKPFVAFSQDRHRIRWRFEQKLPTAAPANVVGDVAAQVPLKQEPGPLAYNPDILVRKGNP
jgi:hypothetical protein